MKHTKVGAFESVASPICATNNCHSMPGRRKEEKQKNTEKEDTGTYKHKDARKEQPKDVDGSVGGGLGFGRQFRHDGIQWHGDGAAVGETKLNKSAGKMAVSGNGGRVEANGHN